MEYFSKEMQVSPEKIKLLDICGKQKNVIPTVEGHKRVLIFADESHEDPVFLEQQRTLGNVLVYDDYRKARDNFNRQKLSGPDSLSVVKNLQKYSDEMIALKRSMDLDAPDDVLRFFEALDRHNHASLTLLTPGVITWLEEKDMLPAFNVTRKRMI